MGSSVGEGRGLVQMRSVDEGRGLVQMGVSGEGQGLVQMGSVGERPKRGGGGGVVRAGSILYNNGCVANTTHIFSSMCTRPPSSTGLSWLTLNLMLHTLGPGSPVFGALLSTSGAC